MNRNKKILLAVIAALLLAAIIGAVCIGMRLAPAASHALRISELLQPVINAKNQAMRISVSAGINNEPISLSSDVYLVTEEDTQYLVLEQEGMTLYITDNVLLLENGKAFRLGEKMQAQTASYGELLPQIGALYDILKITAEETENTVAYEITVTGEQMDTLLAAASVGETLPVDGIQKLNLRLTEQNETLEQIRFTGNGEIDGSNIQLDVTVSDFRILASGDYPIPESVRQSAATVNPGELFSLSEDLYRLVLAIAPLAEMGSIDATVDLQVDCGPVQLDTQMQLADLKTSDFGQIDPQQIKTLPEMIALLCMEGDISCAAKGDAYVYTLHLDEDTMQQLVCALLPELQQYVGNLTDGVITVTLAAGELASMEVAIEGNINALIARIPITVDVMLSFT